MDARTFLLHELAEMIVFDELPGGVENRELIAFLEDVCIFYARGDIILPLFARIVDTNRLSPDEKVCLLMRVVLWESSYHINLEGCDDLFFQRMWFDFFPREMSLEEKLVLSHDEYLSSFA